MRDPIFPVLLRTHGTRRSNTLVSYRNASTESKPKWFDAVLAALAEEQGYCHECVQVEKLKNMCGFPGKTNSFRNNVLYKLKKMGAIDYPAKGMVSATKKGLDRLGGARPKLLTNEERLADVKEKRVKGIACQEIFDLCSDGKEHTYEECAKACSKTYDPESASFNNNIMFALCKADVLEKIAGTGGKGRKKYQAVRLTDLCFPRGRPN